MARRRAPAPRSGRGDDRSDHLALLLDASTAATASVEAETHPTKRKILAAAIAVFAEQGYRGATTRIIAEQAGVAEKTLFAHYGSKASLFAAAMGPGLEALMGAQVFAELAPRLMAAGTVRERLTAVARNRLEFAAAHVDLVKALVQEILLDTDFRDRVRDYWARNLLRPIRAAIGHGVTTGTLREMNPDTVLRMFVSLVLGYIVTRHVLLPDLAWDDDAELDAMIDTLMRGLAPDP